ncbi:hypothetical protein ACHQM5_026347 [Ranunculus cassubicifolius]
MTSSREVWVALDQHFSSKSKSRILHLRRELHNVKKGSKSMQQYFLQVKQLADNLAASGNKISETDLQYTILTGLDSSYDSIVASLTAGVSTMSMDDFYSHLLTFELRLEEQVSIAQPQPIANVAQKNTQNYRPNNSNKKFFRGSSSKTPNQNNRGYHQRMSPSRSSIEGPCQLCGRNNHSVFNCYHRYDRSFYPHVETPKAYIAAPSSFTDSNWIPDSGATHHLTSDLQNLHLHSSYDGPDQIRVGNGNTLNISNTGSSHGDGTAARSE